MAAPDKSIDPRLLASAQAEFMKHGYLKAELKTICENAEVMFLGLIASAVPFFMVYRIIEPLLDGIDTLASDGGKQLSGGECQRISLARAILKNDPVIVLDGTTAFIDPENE